MVYYCLWILVRITLPVYLKCIHITGKKNLSPGKPLIFACNHPNSFLDALILATMLSPQYKLHFLVRSDVFRKRWANKVLRAMNQIPVYRRQEGLKNMKRNSETFREVTEALNKNNSILIFSEGISTQHRRLQPLKKGTARMALEAYSNGVKDVKIVPVGINYSTPTSFRSEVLLNFGEVIDVAKIAVEYERDVVGTVKELTQETEQRLKSQVIHIEKEELEQEFEKQAKHNRQQNPSFPFPFVRHKKGRFATEKEIEKKVNEGEGFEAKRKSNSRLFILFALLITAPIFIIGQLFAYFPSLFSEAITKSKVKLPEFYASVRLGTGMVFYIIQLLVLTIVVGILCGWQAFVLLFLAPFFSYWSFVWRDALLDNIRPHN